MSTPQTSLPGPDRARTLSHYDTVMYAPLLAEYYGHSDFANFGYWDPPAPDQQTASAQLVDRLLSLLDEVRGPILDVACGKGASTRQLARHIPASAITGTNISEKQLATARTNAPGSTFLLMDAVALDFPDASFANVICVEAAFHFDTREAFLHEALRVLQPGGMLALSDVVMTREAERRRNSFTERNHLDTLDEYVALGRRVGFKDVTVIDATEECFRGWYRHLVGYVHEKYLRREIELPQLEGALEQALSMVGDLRCYLLASLRKA